MIPHLQRFNVLLAELKRRQVFRAAAVYAVAAWAVIEVTSTVLPLFLLPEWIVRAVAGVMVLGFPIVLSLAWAFDLTSQGVQRTGEAKSTSPAVQQFARSLKFRTTLALLVVLFTAGAGWVSWQVWLKPGALRAPDPHDTNPSATLTDSNVGGELDPTNLAVLYFDDFSPDGELAYLANGITESLIYELSRFEPLNVVSRNGVKPYRDPVIPMDSLARVLGVGRLVEGSVEGSGNRISVRVHVVDGGSGMRLHSEIIGGQGEDLLALRDSIVRQATLLVGDALGRDLRSRRIQAGTQSAAAWDLYQRAQHLLQDADTLLWALGDTAAARRTLLRADSLYAGAAEEDRWWGAPLIARGWNARVRAGLFSASATTRDRDLLEAGLEMAEAALRLDPEDPEALELRGSLRVDLFRQGYDGDGAELARLAEEDLRAAAAADESRAFAHVSLADLLRLQGDFREASIAAQHALDADPFLINAEKEILFMLSQTWLDVGDIARAEEWIDAGRSRFPAEPSFSAVKLVLLAGAGGMVGAVDTAYALLDQMERVFDTPVWTFGRLQVAAVLAQHSMPDSAEVLVAQGRGTGSEHPFLDYFEANVRLHLGQNDRALDLLEEFLTALPMRRKYIAQDWLWEPLRDNPRFQGLIAEDREPSTSG